MKIKEFQRNRKDVPGRFVYGVVGRNTNNMHRRSGEFLFVSKKS